MDRRLTFSAIAAAHIGVMATMVMPTAPLAAQRDAVMMVIAIPAEATTPSVLPQMHETVVVADVAAPVFDTVAALPPAPADTGVTPVIGADECGLAETVGAALRGDPVVRGALQHIPAQSRSVANAVLIWNGEWSDAESVGGEAILSPIRNAVIASVAAAPEACRSAAVVGPRLLLIADAPRPMLLAMGSGIWAWGQLANGKTAGSTPQHVS